MKVDLGNTYNIGVLPNILQKKIIYRAGSIYLVYSFHVRNCPHNHTHSTRNTSFLMWGCKLEIYHTNEHVLFSHAYKEWMNKMLQVDIS